MTDPISRGEISGYSLPQIQSLAIEQSREIYVLGKLLKKQEREIGRLARALGEKNQQVLLAADSLSSMKKQMFGRSSERQESSELGPIFSSEESVSEDRLPVSAHNRRKRTGRRPQPELPVRENHHTYSSADMKKHNLKEWVGQTEDSDEITVIPSQIIIDRHRRQKYFQTNPTTDETSIITAPGPLKLKEGSRYSIDFAVEVGLAKYLWHLPLDRQRRMLASHGLEITTSVIFDQIDTLASYLRPTVFRQITEAVKSARVTSADDTTWPNLEKVKTRKKDKFYLWGVTNGSAICYNVFESRSQKVARDFLGGLEGILVTDGHSSFRALASSKLTLAHDWYHVRRKFLIAQPNFQKEADFFIRQIRLLAEIEARIKGRPPPEILAVRTQESVPIVNLISEYAESIADVLPESALGRALKYMRRLWNGLTVFLTDPDVPLSTNDIERGMRGPAVGRKNFYGSRSLETAEIAAIWYSIVETCKLCGVDPRTYIRATVRAILAQKPVVPPWDYRPSDITDLIGT